MINLIPPNDQYRLRRKRLKRLFSAFGFFVMAIFAIEFVMLLPSYIALRFMTADLSYAREVEERSPSSRALEERTRALVDLESQARSVLAHVRKTPSFDDMLEEVVRIAPAGIDLITMRFEEGTLAIEGYYQRRASFLTFLGALKTNTSIKNISSPLSNLLKEIDSSFYITLSL